jgi:hypothetical protein
VVRGRAVRAEAAAAMRAVPRHPAFVAGGSAIDVTFSAVVVRTCRHAHASPSHDVGADNGTCNLCFKPDFLAGDTFGDRTMLFCDSCEREYHVGCLRDAGACDLAALPEGEFFCSDGCKRLCDAVLGVHPSLGGVVPEQTEQ